MTNAIQFIQQHGVDKAREVVEGAPDWASEYCTDCKDYVNYDDSCYDGFSECESCVSVNNLKRLVESVDIVNRACGAERVIELHNRYKDSHVAHKYWLGVRVDRMKQAIADYESIYGGEHV